MTPCDAFVPLKGATLKALGRRITGQLGLQVPADRWPQLCRLLEDPAVLARWTAGPLARADVEALAEQLAIGETYFFRDTAAFALIEQELLPTLLDRAPRIKASRPRAPSPPDTAGGYRSSDCDGRCAAPFRFALDRKHGRR